MIGLEQQDALDSALESAERAAESAHVKLRSLTEISELHAVVALFSEVWGREESPPVTIELLRAFVKAGNYIGGAFDGDRMLGAAVAFSSPGHDALHSHIAGVSGAARGRNVGFALKLHQRVWAMERGISEIAWTFDPLVSRNAYFNLVKLAAAPVEYLTNFYGGMHDNLNGSDDTDRLLVQWNLTAAPVVAACAGRGSMMNVAGARALGAVEVLSIGPEGDPVLLDTAFPSAALLEAVPTSAVFPEIALVAIPDDIEAMRAHNPAQASLWRAALRTALNIPLGAGGTVTSFDRSGWYILQSPHSARSPLVGSDERTTS